MNALLWTLQILLALWHFVGGIYMAGHYEALTTGWANALPKPLWIAHAIVQIACAQGLILKAPAKAAPVAAFVLVLLAGLDAFLPLNAQYAGFPGMLWALVPGLLALVVALGRLGAWKR